MFFFLVYFSMLIPNLKVLLFFNDFLYIFYRKRQWGTRAEPGVIWGRHAQGTNSSKKICRKRLKIGKNLIVFFFLTGIGVAISIWACLYSWAPDTLRRS